MSVLRRSATITKIAVLFVAAVRAGSLYENFRNPPRQYSLMPYWYWNGRISPAETRRQIEEMIGQGVYQAVVFPWDGMEPPYLSEDYWRQVAAALDIARELDFTLNFADEYDWPSGHAWDAAADRPELSRVLVNHPEFRMRRLEYAEHTIEGPRTWKLKTAQPMALAVAARLDATGRLDQASLQALSPRGKSVRWQAPAGRWLVTTYTLAPAVGAHNTRVDLLNPDAVKTYLDLVYEEYARRFPQHLGSTLRLTIADHEGAYGAPIAWTPRLWEEFRRRKRYDLERVLPLLVHEATDPALARRVRRDYLEVISELYVESFSKQVADWCRRHGLGHGTSLYEEQLYIQVAQAGDMFRHWRAGSFVMIDALLERARMPLDFKEAVSVAHLEGMPLVVENQGLQGHATFLSPEKMRLGTNMCLLWGANLLVPYFDYDPKKVSWPPQWFLGQPFWRYFHRYADYVRRAQYMNAQGRHVAPVAIYYPLETAFANSAPLFVKGSGRDLLWGNVMDQVQNFYGALQLELARNGWDYHVLDSHYLQRAEVRAGALHVGEETFRVLILPPMTELDERAAVKIRALAAGGGAVFALGTQPSGLDGAGIRRFPVREHKPFMDRLDYMRRTPVPLEIQADLRPLLEALRSIEPPPVEVNAGQGRGVYLSRRRSEDTEWYWVVNDTPQEREVTGRFRGGSLEKWDAETGERCTLGEGPVARLRFSPWDAYFVVRASGAGVPACPAPRETVVLTLPQTGWQFRPEAPKLYAPYAQRAGDAEPLWLAPERRSNREWWLIGPFPYEDHKGFFRAWPPERGFKRSGKYKGAYGQVRWKWHESPTYTVTLRDGLGLADDQTMGVYYAHANVYSPAARRARILAAFADSLRVWWNGKLALSVHRHPKWSLLRDAWAESRPIDLRRGWNRVLLKIGPSLMVPTAFLFRITDETGATLRDLVYAPEKKLPAAESRRERLVVAVPPGAAAVEIPRFSQPWRLLVDDHCVDAGDTPVPLAAGARTVTFEIDNRDEPEHPIAFPTRATQFALASWTESALAHYSGAATYETRFQLPEADLGKRLVLDLGDVGVAAEVWLNGAKAGERAWRPFRFDITGLARPSNTLRIQVANSDAGWQSQGDAIYPHGSWGLSYHTERERLKTLRPNGLEGPVSIIAVE